MRCVFMQTSRSAFRSFEKLAGVIEDLATTPEQDLAVTSGNFWKAALAEQGHLDAAGPA